VLSKLDPAHQETRDNIACAVVWTKIIAFALFSVYCDFLFRVFLGGLILFLQYSFAE